MMSEISLRHSYEDALSIAARSTTTLTSRLSAARSNFGLIALKFDPGFKKFWAWCQESGTPLVVISSCAAVSFGLLPFLGS